jgi:hypothetical protein
VVLYVHTDQFYAQPFFDMKSIWVGKDGYWWSTNNVSTSTATLHAWVVASNYNPPDTMASAPPGAIASAVMNTRNDTDNDLLPDGFEPAAGQDRYDDPDNDGADNLEEFLKGTNPSVADNDSDHDGLPDTWEMRYFGTLAYGPSDDPDGDGLLNSEELLKDTHPGRRNIDADDDGLPDTWERRRFGSLSHGADEISSDGMNNRDLYERGVLLFTDDLLVAGRDQVRAVHVLELRTRIDALRSRYALTVFAWTVPAPAAGGVVRVQHIAELRTALAPVFTAAGQAPPTYDPELALGLPIKMVHITELRSAIVRIE